MSLQWHSRGPISIVELTRPEKANAYTYEMLRAMSRGLESLDAKVLIVCSQGQGAFFDR